jgi:methyl-accepting chemotaxis protein PixJ
MTAHAPLTEAIQAYEEARYDEAIERLAPLVAESPNDAQLRLWLANACQKIGLLDEAKHHFEEVLKLTMDQKLSFTARSALADLGKGFRREVASDLDSSVLPPAPVQPSAPTFLENPSWRGTPVESTGATTTSKPSLIQRLSLRTKATLLAITIGLLPVVVTGALAYKVADNAVTQKVNQNQVDQVSALSNQLSLFMLERFGDVQLMSILPAFTDPRVSKTISDKRKTEILESYVQYYGYYDSIVLIDLNGRPIVQSGSGSGEVQDFAKTDYFVAVLKDQKPIISSPRRSQVTGKFSIFAAAPVRDVVTGKMIGVIRTQIPQDKFRTFVQKVTTSNFVVANPEGIVFSASDTQDLGKKINEALPGVDALRQEKKASSKVLISNDQQKPWLVAYSPNTHQEGVPDLGWSTVIAVDTATAYAAQQELLLALLAGTGITALLVSIIAAAVANRALVPILNATKAVQRLGEGDLAIRLKVQGEDELASLGNNINGMAGQLQDLLTRQDAARQTAITEADRQRLLATLGSAPARTIVDLSPAFNQLLATPQKQLGLDRLVVYSFKLDGSGYIVAEAVEPGWPLALSDRIADSVQDPCITQERIDFFRTGGFVANNNVLEAGYCDEHNQLLERLDVKANLIIPLLSSGEVRGLIVAHHCTKTHNWTQAEIEELQQLSTQLSPITERFSYLEQLDYSRELAETVSAEQRTQKEALQMQLINLLDEVEGAAQGDLTVRANVTAGEIGIVGDFFNAIIENLRKIVTQVKTSTANLNTSLGDNEGSMRSLAEDANRQSEEIARTLGSVEYMTLSIQEVAESARKAADVAKSASVTAEEGGLFMDRTVAGILDLRETVAETSKKVKRLGESSQKISKVVSLINQIALQTNVLAINASIEAARAGEEGRGFAVVAAEVGALASRSAAATREIEQLVENIQSETSEVVDAMETGTSQVVEGTRLVEEAKKSLKQIQEVSRQIDDLVGMISSNTITQAQTSQAVTTLMKQIAAIAERSSDSSVQVSDSLRQTVQVAQDLQRSVAYFKIPQ